MEEILETFIVPQCDGVSQLIRIDETLFPKTEILVGEVRHTVSIFKNNSIGTIISIDDTIRYAGEDGVRIAEYLAHWPMFAHRHQPKAPVRALVINMGDGAVAQELAKHPGLSVIDVVDMIPGLRKIVAAHVSVLVTDQSNVKYHEVDPWAFVREKTEEVCGKEKTRSSQAKLYDIVVWNDQGEAPPDALTLLRSLMQKGAILIRAIGSYSLNKPRCILAAEEGYKTFSKQSVALMSLSVSLGQAGIWCALVMTQQALLVRECSQYATKSPWVKRLSYYDFNKHAGVVRPFPSVARELALTLT